MAKMPRHKCWSDQPACIPLDTQRAPPVTCSTYQCHYSRPYVPGDTWKCYYTEQKKQEFQQRKERLIYQVSRYAKPDTLCRLRGHLEQQERALPGLCCCGNKRCSSKLTNELCCSRRWRDCAQSGMCVYTPKPCCWAKKGCCWKDKRCFCNQWSKGYDKSVRYSDLERSLGELGRSFEELGWSLEDRGRRSGYQWQPCGDGWHRANYENTQCPAEFALLPWPQQKMALADVHDSSLSTKSIPQCVHLPCASSKPQQPSNTTGSCGNTGKGFGTMYISGKKMF